MNSWYGFECLSCWQSCFVLSNRLRERQSVGHLPVRNALHRISGERWTCSPLSIAAKKFDRAQLPVHSMSEASRWWRDLACEPSPPCKEPLSSLSPRRMPSPSPAPTSSPSLPPNSEASTASTTACVPIPADSTSQPGHQLLDVCSCINTALARLL